MGNVVELDTRGLRCPLPVIRLEAVMRGLSQNGTVRVTADDPLATIDLPLAAQNHGWSCRKIASPAPECCVFEVTRDG